MGSDQIGNHVGNTIGYEAEKSKLVEATHIDHTGIEPSVVHEITTTDTVSEDVQVDGSQQSEQLEAGFNPAAFIESLRYNTTVADPVDLLEFQDFKRQVIKAFKHLGLDTAKHFTE